MIGKHSEITTDNGFKIHQRRYIEKLKLLGNLAGKNSRSKWAKQLWVEFSRPESCSAVTKLAKVTDKNLRKMEGNRSRL